MAKPIGQATLIHRRDLNETLAIFRFKLEDGVPDFEPGQFITLGMPDEESEKDGKMLWRAYSVASAPSCKDWIELYVRHAVAPVPGRFTSMLWELPLGGTLAHRGVTGPFTIERTLPSGEPDLRTLLLVGGGTGVAPFMSYCVELERENAPRRAIVLHGASYVEELGYDDVLRDMERRTAGAGDDGFRLLYVPTISRPQEEKNSGWDGETGRAEALLVPAEEGALSRLEQLAGERLTPERFFVHVCGFGGTCKATQEAIEPLGFVDRRHRRDDGGFDLKVESYG